VELFGLPGAGKSTIARHLDLPTDAIRREDLAAARKALTAGQMARLVLLTLRNWRWLAALAMLALTTPIWHPDSLGRLIRLAVARTWIASQRNFVLLDQGPLQALWSIFYSEGASKPPRKALVEVLRQLYADIGVVLVELEVRPEIAAGRISRREDGNSRLDGLPVGTTQRELQAFSDLPDELLAAARLAGLEVRSLSGEKEINWLGQQVQNLANQQVSRVA
jgi:hypothetical protein